MLNRWRLASLGSASWTTSNLGANGDASDQQDAYSQERHLMNTAVGQHAAFPSVLYFFPGGCVHMSESKSMDTLLRWTEQWQLWSSGGQFAPDANEPGTRGTASTVGHAVYLDAAQSSPCMCSVFLDPRPRSHVTQ